MSCAGCVRECLDRAHTRRILADVAGVCARGGLRLRGSLRSSQPHPAVGMVCALRVRRQRTASASAWVSAYCACGCTGYAVVCAFRQPDGGAVGSADGDADGDAECDAHAGTVDRAERRPDGRAECRTNIVAIIFHIFYSDVFSNVTTSIFVSIT